MQHIKKNVLQLRNAFAHIFIPADEIKMLDKADCFDADLVEKGDWVARADVGECRNGPFRTMEEVGFGEVLQPTSGQFELLFFVLPLLSGSSGGGSIRLGFFIS